MADDAGSGGLRVLVAFKRGHASYGGALVDALGALLPGAELLAADASGLGEALASYLPDAVVSDMPEPTGSAAFAWVELAIEPTEESTLRAGDQEWRTVNPGIEEIARIVELARRRDGRP